MNATMDGMYPFLPADALISTRPGMYTLDGQQFPLTTEEAERLSELAPLLNGRLPLRQAVLEVDPQVYERQGDPYQDWAATYRVDPEIFAPIRQHIRDDVESDHAQLFRAAALASAPGTLPMEVAISTLLSARTVFEATRLWQREMYEYYQLRASTPGRAAL